MGSGILGIFFFLHTNDLHKKTHSSVSPWTQQAEDDSTAPSLPSLHEQVGHAVDLRQLLAVQRGQQFPRAGQRGDKVLSQRHRRPAADISAGATGNDTANRWRSAKRCCNIYAESLCVLLSPVVNPASGHQAQPLHVEDDGLEHPRQRVGEGNLRRHLLTHHGPAHRLREGETQLSSCFFFLFLEQNRTNQP